MLTFIILVICLFIISFILQNKLKPFKIIYLFFKTIPCLFSNLFNTITSEYNNTSTSTYLILLITMLLIGIYILLPCFIRYMYLKNPYGTDSYLKSTFTQKITDLKKTINTLEQTINRRKIMTPKVKWNDNWVYSKKEKYIDNKLKKLGYKDDTESKTEKIRKSFINMCEYYVTPKLFPMLQFKQKLQTNLAPPLPLLNITKKYILKENEQMKKDIKLLLKLKYDLEKIIENFNNYKERFNTKQIINKPIYIDKETTDESWSFENLNDMGNYNYKYSLSLWVFIHEQPPSHGPFYKNFASIFNYGNKPQILYNMELQKLRILMNKKTILYETEELPMQKWNNILFNFDGGILDIYINNKLIASRKNIIPHTSHDKITIGQKNGLSGGICNIVYFPYILSTTAITMYYESIKNNSPPVLPNCIL